MFVVLFLQKSSLRAGAWFFSFMITMNSKKTVHMHNKWKQKEEDTLSGRCLIVKMNRFDHKWNWSSMAHIKYEINKTVRMISKSVTLCNLFMWIKFFQKKAEGHSDIISSSTFKLQGPGEKVCGGESFQPAKHPSKVRKKRIGCTIKISSWSLVAYGAMWHISELFTPYTLIIISGVGT